MKFKIKMTFFASISLLFFSVHGFSDTIKYYNSDGAEISAEAYQKEAKIFKNKHRRAARNWNIKKADPILQCIILSGLNQAIESLPGIIQAQAAQRKLTSDLPDLEEKMLKIFTESFDPDSANQDLYQYLKENLDQQTIKDVLLWLKTPLARKITEEEKAATGAQAQADMLRYLADLQSNPPPPDRVAVIQKYVKESKLVERSFELVVGVMKGMMGSINLLLPDEKKLPEEKIDKQIAEIKPVMEQALRQQLTMSTFYTYRNISNDELETYINHLVSESGSKFTEIALRGISNTVIKLFNNMGGKIAALAGT